MAKPKLGNGRYYRSEKFNFKNTMIDNLSMSNTKSLLLSLSLITLLIMVLTSNSISITLAKTKNDLPRLIGKLGQITIIKKVINNGGGTKNPSDFTITLTANTVTGPFKKTFQGSAVGRTINIQPSTYKVTETGSAGYNSHFSSNCNSHINLGQTKSCIITNTFKPLIGKMQ
jgi:hypothetical protein